MPREGVGLPIIGGTEDQLRTAILGRKIIAVTEICDRDQGDELYLGFDNGMVVRLASPERIRLQAVDRMPDD